MHDIAEEIISAIILGKQARLKWCRDMDKRMASPANNFILEAGCLEAEIRGLKEAMGVE